MASPVPETVVPAHTPAYKRLTDAKRVTILQLDKIGKTQVEIAEIVDCDQSTISRWLTQCRDTTKEANAYLRGQALRMSRNIVMNGKPSDHIDALEGISVLAPEQKPSITVQIGIRADRVRLLEPTFACSTQALSVDMHSLSADAGSDNS